MKFSYPSGAKPLQGYTIKRGIGIGGFGEVYFALNDAGKEVALKKIQRNMDIELRGVRQCLNIRHVNLISLWDIRTSKSNESWVVMEYVPGPSLRDILDDHPRGLPIPLLKLWFTSIASGVAYLHHRGIVHRDLKPANVFRDDDAHVIKIGDYGLSKFISCNHQSGQTGTVGTVHYMAPEISKGDYGKEVDIYALGIILYELLTGDVPFDGETSQEIMYKHLLDAPDMSAVPEDYRTVVRGCLTKEPGTRYSNVSALMAAMPWEEFSGERQKLLSLHSVGVFPKPEFSADTSVNLPTESVTAGARIEPILISNEDAKTQMPEIVFGALSDYEPSINEKEQDRKRQLRKTTPPRNIDGDESGGLAVSKPDNPELAEIESPKIESPKPEKKLAKRTTVVGIEPVHILPTEFESGSLAPIENPGRDLRPKKGLRFSQRKRIFAKKVARKCDSLSQKMASNPVATPARLAMLMFATWLVISAPVLLPSIAIVLGIAYASWYLMRFWAGESEIEREQRKSFKSSIRNRKLRDWIESQPGSDRAVEFLGAAILGIVSCTVLSFAGFAIYESQTLPVISGWAFYAWMCVASVVTSIGILSVAKFRENDSGGDAPFGRFVSAGIGLLGGIVAIASANTFHVDLTHASFVQYSGESLVRTSPLPLIPSYLILFATLFGVIRWWRQADPIRNSRLSLWNVGLCFVWAAGLSQILNLPLIGNCLFAVVVSVSVQIAAPWLSPQKRNRLCGPEGKSDKVGNSF